MIVSGFFFHFSFLAEHGDKERPLFFSLISFEPSASRQSRNKLGLLPFERRVDASFFFWFFFAMI